MTDESLGKAVRCKYVGLQMRKFVLQDQTQLVLSLDFSAVRYAITHATEHIIRSSEVVLFLLADHRKLSKVDIEDIVGVEDKVHEFI